jgi:hypothetical protein
LRFEIVWRRKGIAMKKLLLASVLFLSVLPALARAQVSVQIQLGLPAAPPLVAVEPGIQVVENWNEEVFFTGGYYWVRRDDRWYRARGPRAAFVYVEPRRVPTGLVRMPPGQYVRYQKHQEKAERKAWKQQEKADKKAWKEQEKADKKGGKHQGHGHE